jgi:hypothetical protein
VEFVGVQQLDPKAAANHTDKLLAMDNEGHGFHNEENRFDFYRAMEKFFGKHLKGVRPEGDIVPESCRR